MRVVLPRSLALLLLTAAALTAAPTSAEVRTRHVTLEEFTSITLELVPDLGTRLVFPFRLNEASMQPGFEQSLTNNSVFSYAPKSGDGEAFARNSILLSVDTPKAGGPMPQYKGTYFASIAGYHVTIELTVSQSLDRHVHNVVFELPDDKRDYLIDAAVERRTEQLEQEFEQKKANLQDQVERQSMGYVGMIALETPEYTNVKEGTETTTGQGLAVDVFADRYERYSGLIALRVVVENLTGRRARIQDLRLAGKRDGQRIAPTTSSQCDGKLRPDASVQCVIATEETSILNTEETTVTVVTDRGEAELKW
jgi:hypothetical protein